MVTINHCSSYTVGSICWQNLSNTVTHVVSIFSKLSLTTDFILVSNISVNVFDNSFGSNRSLSSFNSSSSCLILFSCQSIYLSASILEYTECSKVGSFASTGVWSMNDTGRSGCFMEHCAISTFVTCNWAFSK